MSKLKIYRASAGSGKTFTLTLEFILLLFKYPFDYKHILAVTFTNKATAEMKSRILNTLYSIWIGEDKDYTEKLVEQEGSEEKIHQKSGFILYLLLHDFSRFSVSTIDSFFQKIIRSFVHELGLQSSFKTELNSSKILRLAIDRLIMKLGQKDKAELRNWLIQTARENMEQGQTWNIASKLNELGKEIYSESFQSFHNDYKKQLSNRENLEQYKKELLLVIESVEEAVQEYGRAGLKLLSKYDLHFEDFSGKSRTPLKILQKMADLEKFNETGRIKEWIDNPDAWIRDKKNTDLSARIYEAYNNGLNQLLKDSTEFIDHQYIKYNTAIVINKNFNALGIINDIANEIDEICREEMVYLLANSNKLLNKIIDENESPFIFEKSGNTINHFMIDEFQDTSKLQWGNFRPLIENSLAANNYSLLVGDVKQSIYRWRNSDWKVLAQQVKQDFLHQGTLEKSLGTNWRSFENIVNFNNSLFKVAARTLQDDFNVSVSELADDNATDELKNLISDAYFDVAQNVSPKKLGSGGEISIQFISYDDNDDYSDKAVQIAIQHIEEAISKGFELKDICVLVRKKHEAQLITNALLSGRYSSQPYSVVSNEALILSGSIAVNMVISQLKYIIDPSKSVHQGYIELFAPMIGLAGFPSNYDSSAIINEHSHNLNHLLNLKGLPLLDLVEILVNKLPEERHIEEGVFLQALIDLTSEFIQNECADLAKFLEWWENEGQNKSVAVPEDQNAIRIMTIHKSKGLEFDVVILPFLNWKLDDATHHQFLWCEDPFNKIGYIPVQYSSNLLNTSFSPNYTNEKLQQYIDNLNLLYVAFTRAKKQLSGVAPEPKKTMQQVSDLLYSAMKHHDFISEIEKNFPDSENIWSDSLFHLGGHIQEKFQGNSGPGIELKSYEFQTSALPVMKTWNYSDRVAIVMESTDFISGTSDSHLNQGKIYHHLFELIKTKDDTEPAIKQLFIEGIIKEGQIPEIEQKVKEFLDNPAVENWFRKDAKVLNETSILTKEGTYIPDRVIFSQKEIIVIDYKFGETISTNHFKQVRNYMNLIRKMGHQKVTGYLWYVFENKIIDVSKSENLTLF